MDYEFRLCTQFLYEFVVIKCRIAIYQCYIFVVYIIRIVCNNILLVVFDHYINLLLGLLNMFICHSDHRISAERLFKNMCVSIYSQFALSVTIFVYSLPCWFLLCLGGLGVDLFYLRLYMFGILNCDVAVFTAFAIHISSILTCFVFLTRSVCVLSRCLFSAYLRRLRLRLRVNLLKIITLGLYQCVCWFVFVRLFCGCCCVDVVVAGVDYDDYV